MLMAATQTKTEEASAYPSFFHAPGEQTGKPITEPSLSGPFACFQRKSAEDEEREQLELARIAQAEAWNDNIRFLQKLIQRMERGEQVDYGPCHFAASLGNVELMEWLLVHGADKNERDREGNCPLMWAIANDGDEEMMDTLVDHGASVNMQNFVGESPLFLAAQRGSFDKVQYLLELGADVTTMNIEGASPLHAAAAGGHLQVIALLIKHGAHVNAVDHEGDTVLHWAVREGQIKAACLLVRFGADMGLLNEDNESPLDLADCLGETEMARIMRASRADFIKNQEATNDQVVQGMVATLKTLRMEDKRGMTLDGRSVAFYTC